MLRKIIGCGLICILWSNFAPVIAQNSPTLKVKYELRDFKNPSPSKGRYGLMRFSADGKRLAVKGDNETIAVYDAEKGTILQKIRADTDGADGFAFGANNENILLQDQFFEKISVWDLNSGKLVRQIDSRNGFSSVKRKALSVNRENEIRKREGLEAKYLQVSPNGADLLIGKSEAAYQVIDVNSGKPRFTLEQFSQPNDVKDLLKIAFIPFALSIKSLFHVSDASYNKDGNRIVLANGDKIPTLWDAQTGKLVARLEPQTATVYNSVFSPDGKIAATTDTNGITKTWDAATGALLSTFGTKKNREFFAAWSPSADLIVTFSRLDSTSNKISFYESRTGKLISQIKKVEVRRLAFSPDGKSVASISKHENRLLGQIWNVADGQLIAALPRADNDEPALSLEWHPNGKMLIFASVEFVKIFDERGNSIQNLGTAVFPAHFSHDGKLLATGGKNDVGFVWQIEE